MNGFVAALLIIGTLVLQGVITSYDVDNCIKAGKSAQWCNHTFNR